MNTKRHFALLTGTSLLFLAFFCPEDADATGLRTQNPPGSGPASKNFVHPLAGQDSQDALRRKAEEFAREALVLRQKQTSRDFKVAISLYKKSARLFQTAGLLNQAADINLEIGEIYLILSKYPEALHAYRTGLQLAGADEMRCRLLSRMARTYSTTGRNAEAIRYSATAVDLCDKLPSRKGRAEAREARGEALYFTNDSSQAIEEFSRALDLFEENDDGRALTLLMLAESRFEMGGKDEGINLAGRALQLWSSNGNTHGVAQARAALGIFSITAGQFETASCHSQEAQEIFQTTGDEDHRAKVLNTMGYISMQMGETEAALAYWRKSRISYARVQDRLGEASAISVMGKALSAMHHYKELPHLFEEELRLAKQARSKAMEASALADIAGVDQLNGQYARAESHYHQSLAIYHELNHPIGESDILILMAELYTKQGKYGQAISSLKKAFDISHETKQVENEAKILYERAYINRRLNRLEEAAGDIQQTVKIIEAQRLTISKFDSRASYFAAVHNYYALYVQILMLLQRQSSRKQLAIKAFEASEQSKARSLIDWLVESSQDRPCNMLWRRQAQEAEGTPNLAADSTHASEAPANPRQGLRQVQAELIGDDAILLEYSLGDEKSYLWAVTGKEVLFYELPEAKRLEHLVRGLRHAVTARQQGLRPGESTTLYTERLRRADQDYDRYSQVLSRLLLGPAPLRSFKRVIVVPDGPLQYVPFAALLVSNPGKAKTILVAAHEVVILPSAAALAALRKDPGNRRQPTSPAAVFANPVFELPAAAQRRTAQRVVRRHTDASSCAREAWRDIQSGSEHIPALPETHREAQAVRQSLGDKVFVAEGFQASREAVLNLDLAAYRILHFATHAIIDEKHLEWSGLILSLVNERGEPQDGCLRLSDIYQLKVSADLVVLSSCESALGKDLSSEGIIGLPRSFLRAGAKSVIATLWKVEDAATADLMTRFYYHLQLGETPASALRKSQLDLWRGGRWPHQYYWAAFVLQGEYR